MFHGHIKACPLLPVSPPSGSGKASGRPSGKTPYRACCSSQTMSWLLHYCLKAHKSRKECNGHQMELCNGLPNMFNYGARTRGKKYLPKVSSLFLFDMQEDYHNLAAKIMQPLDGSKDKWALWTPCCLLEFVLIFQHTYSTPNEHI